MKNKKKLFVTLGSVGAVVIVGLIVTVVVLLSKPETPPPTPTPTAQTGGRGTVAVPENVEELRRQAEQPVEDGYYTTKMNVDWVFPSSDEPSENAYVENSVNNKRTVYFDLTLADTGELIYSSPFIPVGSKLEKFTLDTQLAAGEYQGIVTYHLVDDDHQELTTVAVTVTMRIRA